MATRIAWVALLVLAVGAGCGGSDPARTQKAAAMLPPAQEPAPIADAAPGKPAAAQALSERKIIFSGTLDVEVKDYAAAYAELAVLMKKYAAFFAKTEIRGDSGQKRAGTFTIKVPVGNFQPLVESLAALGNPVRNATDSQDVTEEYVDVEARVKNFKAEEEALNKLLKEAGTRLEDVIRIREQVRQNREQIERAEGRLNALGKLASLSTVTLTLRDREEYVAATAAQVAEPPPFRERVADSFGGSFGALRSLAETVALALVAATPWLLLVLPAVAVAWWGRRRLLL